MDDLLRPLSTNPSGRAACLAALRRLQDDVLPRAAATPLAARQLLVNDNGKSDDDECFGTDANSNSLGRILLGVVGDSSVAEICRERAMLLLKALLQKSVTSDEPEGSNSSSSSSSSNCAAEDDYDATIRSRRHMVQYYVDYCAMVRRRIASSSSKLVVGERNYSCGSESDREPSESIRLELLLALSPLFRLLPNTGGNDDHDDGEDNDDAMVVEEASSKLCLAMTQGCCPALLDPYTAIHRESCHIIMQLAVKVPSVVAQHSSELLAQLVGTSTVGDQNTPAEICGGLMTHRQAKTRCVAIDAVTAILSCCDTSTSDGRGSVTDPSRIETLLESAHVLSRWEDGPAFDRSAQVRLSVQRSLGKVCRVVFLGGGSGGGAGGDQTEKNESMTVTASNTSGRPSTLSVGRRLISLLLVGLSDDVECVREVASEEMQSLRGGRGDNCPDDQLSKYANVVLLHLLQDATKTCVAVDKRVRVLHAATGLLEELIEAGDMNSVFVGGDCHDSATTAAEISSSLCLCFNDDHIELSSAASACAQVLGTDTISSASLIRYVLDTLRGGSTAAGCDGRHHPPPDRSVSSSLFLLESLLRGHCTSMSEAARRNDGLLPLPEIGAALHSEIVLDAIFPNEESATPRNLLGACDTFSDAVTIDASASGRECYLVSSMIEQILIAAMYILSATNETEANDLSSSSSQPYRGAINLLLAKAAAALRLCGIGHASDEARHSHSDVMRRHFRGVLLAIQPKDGAEEGQHLSRRLGAVGALIRSCEGSVVAENYDVVGPIFNTYANKEESKFSIMTLLESIASDKTFAQTIDSSNVLTIVENVVHVVLLMLMAR